MQRLFSKLRTVPFQLVLTYLLTQIITVILNRTLLFRKVLKLITETLTNLTVALDSVQYFLEKRLVPDGGFSDSRKSTRA
jgi:hypothetical protein